MDFDCAYINGRCGGLWWEFMSIFEVNSYLDFAQKFMEQDSNHDNICTLHDTADTPQNLVHDGCSLTHSSVKVGRAYLEPR